MKKDIYKIENSIEKLLKDKHTLFLDQRELLQVKSKLTKRDYQIYYPNKSAEKVILYKKNIPKVSLIKINTINKLRHQEILGSIMALNLSSSYLGDIIIDNDNYYFYILDDLKEYILNNLISIGNNKVILEEIPISSLEDYERKYEEIEIIVSSTRIDSIISRLINTTRDKVLDKIKNKEVLLNYDTDFKNTYLLKENDIFSIKRYGKYRFVGIKSSTKKDRLIVKILKYV